MDYTNAPACRLLATRCGCCARPLLDAKSVETGIGPDCRARYGFDAVPTAPDLVSARTIALNYAPDMDVSGFDDVRRACNVLVHRFACDPKGNLWVPLAVYALGYTVLSEKLAARGGTVEVTPDPADAKVYRVRTPYDPGFNARLQNVPGRRWDKAARVWLIPVTSRKPLWDAVKGSFKGFTLKTTQGLSVIG